MHHPVAAALCLVVFGAAAHAQQPVAVDPAVAAQHLIDHPAPFYPPIARADHIEGMVLIRATIDANGHIQDAHALSGPGMLIRAGLETISKYVYAPFLVDGKQSPVTTFVAVHFALNGVVDKSEEAPEINFFQAYLPCGQTIVQNATPGDQVQACLRAVEAAESLPKSSHLIERRGAYIEYATALLHAGKFNDAVNAGNQAVALVRRDPGNTYGVTDAYEVTAEAHLMAGDRAAADADLTRAEKAQIKILGYLKRAVKDTNIPVKSREATMPRLKAEEQKMQSLLELHAKILTQMGNEKAAEAKRKESAKIRS